MLPVRNVSRGVLVFGEYRRGKFVPYEYARPDLLSLLDGRKSYLIYHCAFGEFCAYTRHGIDEALDNESTFAKLRKYGLVDDDGYAIGRFYRFDHVPVVHGWTGRS